MNIGLPTIIGASTSVIFFIVIVSMLVDEKKAKAEGKSPPGLYLLLFHYHS